MLPPEEIWNGMLRQTILAHHDIDTQLLIQYYETHAIPIHPLAGVVVASIIVSILGSYATLTILGRRTSSRGWRNHVFVVTAAFCFSAVAVWGMHFVSMISIRLMASPNITWYLRVSVCVVTLTDNRKFSKGMNTMSLFVPLIATLIAFYFIDSDVEFKTWRLIISGIFVGLTSELFGCMLSSQLSRLDALLCFVPIT